MPIGGRPWPRMARGDPPNGPTQDEQNREDPYDGSVVPTIGCYESVRERWER